MNRDINVRNALGKGRRSRPMDSVKFREEIDAKVKAKIRELKKSGVVAMSIDNLWQCVGLSPEHGPRGVNAAYYAKEIFAAHVKEKFNKFLI